MSDGGGAPLAAALALVGAARLDRRTVVLVEGASDVAAVEALADVAGRDLDAEGIIVLPIGGSKSFGPFVRAFGPAGLNVRLAGLYDAGEERDVERALGQAGLLPSGVGGTAALSHAGFFRCDADLEDELIRALGVPRVEQVVAADGALPSLRIMQKQPAQRDRPAAEQLRRFIGTRSGRKIRYGRLLVEALDADAPPAPLGALLAYLSAPVSRPGPRS
jgi:hypothetical protein